MYSLNQKKILVMVLPAVCEEIFNIQWLTQVARAGRSVGEFVVPVCDVCMCRSGAQFNAPAL